MRTWQDDFREMLKSGVAINSMASIQKYVEGQLKAGHEKRLEHLLMLYFYPECRQFYNKWMSTIFYCLHEVGRLKRRKSYPSQSFIFKAVYGDYESSLKANLEKIVQDIANRHPNLMSPRFPLGDTEILACLGYLRRYYDWLSHELSHRGSVTFSNVENELTELLSFYAYTK